MDDNHVNIFVSQRSDFDIIRRRLETLLGDHFVPMPDFCPPPFMTRYTRFPDIASMLAASRLPFTTDGEPDKLAPSYRERWDQFVSQTSDFANWKEMEDRAAARWVSDQLTGTGEVPEGQNIHIGELAARPSDSAIDDDPYLPDFSFYNGDHIRAREDLIRAIQATVGLGAGEIERISPDPYLTGETPTIAELHRLFDAAARSYVLSRVANQPELREIVDAMKARKLQPVRRLYRRILFNKGFPLGSPPPDSAPPDEREVALSRAFALFKARFIHGMQRIWMEPEQVADEAYLVVLYRVELAGKIFKVMAHGAARKLKAAAADIRKLPSDIGLMIDQRGVDSRAFFRGLHAGAATVSDTFTFGFFFDEHKRQAWQNIGLDGSDTQHLSEFFATASREIALYALAVGSVRLARTGSKAGMVGVTTFTAIEGAQAAGWSVEVYQQFVQDNYEKALIASAFAILAAFGFREGIDDALKSVPPLANDLGKATRRAADALDEFGEQISDPNTLGSGLGGLGDFGKGSKKPQDLSKGQPPDSQNRDPMNSNSRDLPAEPNPPGQPNSGDRNYVYRGDVHYKKGTPVGLPLGSEAAKGAKIQDMATHVLRKENGMTSRWTSITRELTVAKKFANGQIRFVTKLVLDELRRLEKAGVIRLYNSDQVREILRTSSEKKLRKVANDVKHRMDENSEILIEGEIPGDLFQDVR